MKATKKSKISIILTVGLIFAFVLPAIAQEEPPLDEELEILPEDLQMSGIVEGTGTYFEVTDSEYLNVTLLSSESIILRLESVPEMVIMDIEAAEDATSTEIILTGFEPSTTYYKYEDDYHNCVDFTTDEYGSFLYTQDLTDPHHVFIQTQPSTIFLSASGWKDESGSDPGVGKWDPLTKTGTLTTDVYGTIQIDSNGITLDGAGLNVTLGKKGYGVNLTGRTNVTIKNLNIQVFLRGINLYNCSNNTLMNNTTSNNRYGIYLYESDGNTLTGNTCNSNSNSGIYFNNSNNNTLTDNTCNSNLGQSGIYLHKSDDNTFTDSIILNNQYGIYFYYCNNSSTIGNITNSNNRDGIHLFRSRYNIFADNICNSNRMGVVFDRSSDNTLTENTVSNNSEGIYLNDSSRNFLISNTVCSSNKAGISLYKRCLENILTGNTINSNAGYGIRLVSGAENNQIYNNNFIDNSNQAYVGPYCIFNKFYWNKPTGGNYWSNWTTPDDNGDGFVDFPYIFDGGQDNLPWTIQNGWANKAPVAEAGDNQIVEQTSVDGAYVQLDGSGSYDPDEDELTYEWTWVGGSASGVDPIVQLPPGLTSIILTVYDGKLFDEDTVDVTVQDTIPPEITIDAPEPYWLYRVRDLTLAFSASDSGSGLAYLQAKLSDATGYLVPVEPGDVVIAAGVYTLLVSAVDDAGNFSESEVLFVVFDPDGGFVTGGGWINSPEGAYKPDPLLAGKANFGFVSKYKKGANVPTGNTEFLFKAGDLNFNSSSYDWLVITGSDYARFKGSGSINGEDGYCFMLWAGDKEPDTFRIRIWIEDEIGNEDDVYDNGFDQAIGGGSIIVHTK